MPLRKTVQKSMKGNNLKYVMDKIAGHKKTSKSIQHYVHRDEYDSNDDTYELEAQILAHFATRDWRSPAPKMASTTIRRERRIGNKRAGRELTISTKSYSDSYYEDGPDLLGLLSTPPEKPSTALAFVATLHLISSRGFLAEA